MVRKILHEAALVFLMASVLAAASFTLRPKALPLLESAHRRAAAAADSQLYKEITFDQARQLFEERKALFADARPLFSYEAGHIQGAVHLDPSLLDEWADGLMAGYPSDQPIVTYCEGPRCALSKELAEKLTWLGFEQVYFLVDGWTQWQAHHMPAD